MQLNDYQKQAEVTAVYPRAYAVEYCALGLASEAGEVCSLIKKAIRARIAWDREKLKDELGDVLWYVSSMATELGITLDDVAEQNRKKLLYREGCQTLADVGERVDEQH